MDKLKRTYRFSTREESARDSVADHSWKLALMTISTAEKLNLDVNVLHSVKLALCHDVPEYLTGEIDARLIHWGRISKEEKSKLEEKALKEFAGKFGELGKRVYDLWEEFERCGTREAKYVRVLDKIEAITHLISVEKAENFDMDYTATCANDAVRDFPELKFLLKDVQNKLKIICEELGEEWKKEYEIS